MSGTFVTRRRSNAGTIAWCAAGVLCVLIGCAGCQRVRVNVETHLIADAAWQTRLDGPLFVIAAENEAAASSLAYQEVADLLAEAIEMVRSDMKRAPAGDADDVLFVTMDFRVIDRGSGVTQRPVYGYGGWYDGCGPYSYGHRFGYAATTYDTVHLGYAHSLSASAWVPDDTQPGTRRVLWEGQADLATSERSPKVTMPYLAVALASFYGQATEGSVRIKFKPKDERVDAVWRGAKRHSSSK